MWGKSSRSIAVARWRLGVNLVDENKPTLWMRISVVELHVRTSRLEGAAATSSQRTLPWRKTDSNARSHREGKAYGEPLQVSIAVSDLNL